MTTDKKVEDLQKDIESMEKELAEAKKTLREMKTKGLREAMEARKMADQAVREELKALGYNYGNSPSSFSWYWRDIG